MLRDFTPRLYQQTLLGTAAQHNTLVVLPTGLGKTAVAFLLTAQRLLQYPQSKILMLAPTKPLCEQHLQTFRKHLEIPENKIVLFTGEIAPEKRAVLWKEATIIISTPQGLENDTINKRVDLKDVSLLILDEAHHATGEYSYVWLADQYERLSSFPRILALTASPGSDMESIQEVCKNLKIERVEVRTEKDADVKPYVQHLKKNWVMVEFPQEFRKVQQLLQNCKKSKLIEIQNYGYCRSAELGKGEMLGLQGELQGKLSQGFRDMELLRSVSLLAEAMKVEHALELLETQGIKQLSEYLKKIREESLNSTVKAVKNLVIDSNFKAAHFLTEDLLQKNVQHPKLPKLREIVQEEMQRNPEAKLIIFTQYRDSAEEVVKELTALGVSNHIFVGQAKKKGLGFSQKQQKEILEKFRAGEFKILVATSVAEEGLDIPKVDKVIFFEPVPSAIRAIQRRGRTGRLEEGEVTLLITQGTRDEGYRWSSHHKEKRMHRNLEQLRSSFTATKSEPTLQRFIPENQAVLILADHREKDNKIVKELIELGVSVRTGQLVSADYVLSGKVGVELKKVHDFVDSLIDGRLLEQVRELRNNFDKAVLIIEGEEDIYSIRKVHANALRGLLASIVLDFNIPVLYTKNPRDTAGLLAVMAKREQEKGSEISLHDKKPQTLKEQQEFLIAALPNVGIVTARNLLNYFGSIKVVVNASKEELIKLEGVGEKTAEKLKEVFEGKYGGE